MMAKIEVSADYNLPLIAERAGQSDPKKCFYRGGILHVEGVTQQALASALSGYDDSEDGWPDVVAMDALEASEQLSSMARKLEEVIDYIENGTPLSSHAKDWMVDRKTKRSALQ